MVNEKSYKMEVVWRNVIILLLYHCVALEGLYYMLTLQIRWKTYIWIWIVSILCGQGITAGAHRLWAHKSYKAKLPLRILLCFFQTVALQNSVYEWCRDHRVHHKFTDTDADPHNASRGFFFSHMGWLMVRKHPDVINMGKTIDMNDLEEDSVVRFQKKYYFVIAPFCCFILPTLMPWYFWKEDFYMSFATVGIFRYVLVLHGTWLVNSAAHKWGTKPYNSNIKPAENRIVSSITQGEGWHNYHHTFPWDYKTAELDNYNGNMTKAFIDFMAKIGWAYGLKTAPRQMIQRTVEKNKNQ